jgi:hypothetical protein
MNTTINSETETEAQAQNNTDNTLHADFKAGAGWPAAQPNHARRGKIARLLREIRDELNEFIDEGTPAEEILNWLNKEYDVMNTMATYFDGSPINAQNLTNWRQGGFEEWRLQRERLEFARELRADAAAMAEEACEADLAGYVSTILLAELAQGVKEVLPTLADPGVRCAKIMEYLGTLARVRQQELMAAREARARELHAQEKVQELKRAAVAAQFKKQFEAVILESHAAAKRSPDQPSAGRNAAAQPRHTHTPGPNEQPAKRGLDQPGAAKQSLEPDATVQSQPMQTPERREQTVKEQDRPGSGGKGGVKVETGAAGGSQANQGQSRLAGVVLPGEARPADDVSVGSPVIAHSPDGQVNQGQSRLAGENGDGETQ